MRGEYNSDELKALARTLGEILAEARRYHPDFSIDDIVQRVCVLADRGERDTKNLQEAVFGFQRIVGSSP